MAGTLDLAEAMRRIVSTLVAFFAVRSAALYRMNEAGDTLVCLAGAGGESTVPWVGRTVSLSAGVVGPATAESATDSRCPAMVRMPGRTCARKFHAWDTASGALSR